MLAYRREIEENMLKINTYHDFCKGGENFYAQNSGEAGVFTNHQANAH